MKINRRCYAHRWEAINYVEHFMNKYDVFISSKSEDYQLADQVYEFLVDKGLKVFFAYRTLETSGGTTDGEAIDKALDNSSHMVLVGSSVENINSKYVRYEWSTFSSDLKKGFRTGNLVTVLTDSVKIKSLPPTLRHIQAFRFKNYKEGILPFVIPNYESTSGPAAEPDASTGPSKKWGWMAAIAVVLILLLAMLGYYIIMGHNNAGDTGITATNDSDITATNGSALARPTHVTDDSLPMAETQGNTPTDYLASNASSTSTGSARPNANVASNVEVAKKPQVQVVDSVLPASDMQDVLADVASIPRKNYSPRVDNDFLVNDQRFDWLSQRYATDADIRDLDVGQIRVLKNSIYARHGYIFKDVNLTECFSQCGWYRPEKKVINKHEFNKYEIANVKFLGQHDH